MYPVTRNTAYDFSDESYADSYPNLHKYPATMLPQIGIKLFKELDINSGILLDPYCGSGSSFAAGLESGIHEMHGYDINPLAVLISKAKFTLIDLVVAQQQKNILKVSVNDFSEKEDAKVSIPVLKFFNAEYWFSQNVLRKLSLIHYYLEKIEDENIRQLFKVVFSETLRECSYTRNGEFKLYRIKPENLSDFNPDVYDIFFSKLESVIDIYKKYYFPKLNDIHISIFNSPFENSPCEYDIVLTSPPYGDSRTTVAYGQFSRFTNEWLGISYARHVDKMLMGGYTTERLYRTGFIKDAIFEIDFASHKRALEVSSFYFDLEKSIQTVAQTVKSGGKVIYLVGNRRVKNVQLPTDQFIAEKFEESGFEHLFTYERQIGNKVMPSENSPSNVPGEKSSTMSQEFIVVCERR